MKRMEIPIKQAAREEDSSGGSRVPFPEYPRPAMMRSDWMNLNGRWAYAITEKPDIPARADGYILVPYSPETRASGVERQLLPGQYLHYQRTFHLEEVREGERTLLHFGAVDQECRVFVNGQEAGSHTGGYLSFTLDITGLVRQGENLLQVSVQDFSDTSYHARGKQRLAPGGMWYTAQSGIWQSVWLEQVPDLYIRYVRVRADIDRRRAYIRVTASQKETPQKEAPLVGAVVSFRGRILLETTFPAGKNVSLEIPEMHLWSPEEPNLYDLTLQMGEDCVSSYFAMRKIHVEKSGKGIPVICLNNEPYFQSGVLDQGYWPEGLYTPPSDEAMARDIRRMKELGFTMLRKHIKIEPDRWYYHCDRLGMLVWQDMVCGGDPYRSWFVTYMPNLLPVTGKLFSDRHYGLFGRKNPEGRREFTREVRETVAALCVHPCIVTWVLFNEGWGQFDAESLTAYVRKLDKSRLIDSTSGWFDQGCGDMNSIHNYWRPLRMKPEKKRAGVLSECGGFACAAGGEAGAQKVYGYRFCRDEQDFTDRIVRLWSRQLLPNVQSGLCASVFTQLSDVEDEKNGLLDFQRQHVKVNEETMRFWNRKLAEAYRSCAGRSGSEDE